MTKTAYTLSEVLITLGVIGIVAALTIPTLVSNYQKKGWVTQLKKDVNIIQNAINLQLSEDEVDNLIDSSLARPIKNQSGYFFVQYSKLANKMNVTKVANVEDKVRDNYFSGINNYFYLSDGSCIGLPNDLVNNRRDSQNSYYVDVNCDKGPNVYGKDQFGFRIDLYGKLINSQISNVVNIAEEEVDMIKEMCLEAPAMCKEFYGIKNPESINVEYFKENIVEILRNSCKASASTQVAGSIFCFFDLVIHDNWDIKYY